ncbi:HNH endonuclease signature motif containing protein [Streptomyces sp. NPDC014940]|uniref:HNH endonuclease signature motif containing protein n=1 Tax=Streptomyces sp. NPDC014940 TaxID=3364932 RepID=UPI0036F76F3D
MTALPVSLLAKTRSVACPRPELGQCLVWTAAVSNTGYGAAWDPGTKRVRTAHALAYEKSVGPVPEGLHLDHLCRVRACINPAHLEPVTPGENVRRGNSPGAIAVRTNLCPKGHPLTDDNVTVLRSGTGTRRRCKTCHRARQARYDAARKAAPRV